MKLKISLFCLIIGVSFELKAQTYKTIPDTNFVIWLQTNYPTCMSNKQIDITCPIIKNAIVVDISFREITNLTGIEYFSNLQILQCSNNQLTILPSLPNSLQYLHCYDNQLTSLPTLPNSLIDIDCAYNQLTSIPQLPNSFEDLNCSYNQLTSLPSLPNSLKILHCNNNKISHFPTFPNSLITSYNFNILGNPFSHLPNYVPAMDAAMLAFPLQP